MTNFLLGGLSAANLVGYLAALGTLRSASHVWSPDDVRMTWVLENGVWCPLLSLSAAVSRSDFVAGVSRELQSASSLAVLRLAPNLTIPVESYRAAAIKAAGSSSDVDRSEADFVCALGSESVQSWQNGKPSGQIADTAFRTMSGAGHQDFLGTIQTFIADTGPEHIDKALFKTWRYDDPLEKHSMRWDPMDDIRHALRWANPSGDKQRKVSGSVWGANRLAIEALPLFPCIPVAGRLETTGFIRKKRRGIKVRYAVWEGFVDLHSIRALLTHPELRVDVPDRTKLSAMGVVEVFQSERVSQGKYRNFTPSIPV